MKMRMRAQVDEKVVEIVECDGDVKSILRRPYVVDLVARAMLSPLGKVELTPLHEPTYTREEHMHDGCQ